MMDHLRLPVADLERSVSFYTGVFGLLGLHEAMRVPIPRGTLIGLAGGDGSPFLWFTGRDVGTGMGTDRSGVGQELHLTPAAPDQAGVHAVSEAAEAVA